MGREKLNIQIHCANLQKYAIFLHCFTKFCTSLQFPVVDSRAVCRARRVCGTNRNSAGCRERDAECGICESCFPGRIRAPRWFAGAGRSDVTTSLLDHRAAAYRAKSAAWNFSLAPRSFSSRGLRFVIRLFTTPHHRPVRTRARVAARDLLQRPGRKFAIRRAGLRRSCRWGPRYLELPRVIL